MAKPTIEDLMATVEALKLELAREKAQSKGFRGYLCNTDPESEKHPCFSGAVTIPFDIPEGTVLNIAGWPDTKEDSQADFSLKFTQRIS